MDDSTLCVMKFWNHAMKKQKPFQQINEKKAVFKAQNAFLLITIALLIAVFAII